jgi:excisionase family DNA binding protein
MDNFYNKAFLKNKGECNDWLTTKEAAQHLRISENNLRVKVHRGEVHISGKLGNRLRFRRSELDRLLEGSL